MMREQTLISCFTSRFVFRELTFGKMPILTRRTRASTFQVASARLSKNDTKITFAVDTFFLDTLRPRVIDGSKGVVVFVGHDRYSHAGNCTDFPSNIGLFLSTDNKYLFLLNATY